jgi:hypothetical protein
MVSTLAEIEYVSLAVVDSVSDKRFAIETISISADSCDLSGAWLLESKDRDAIKNIMTGKIILNLGNEISLKSIDQNATLRTVSLEDFLVDAKSEISIANNLFEKFVQQNRDEYAEYMNVKPDERKLIPKVVKKNLVPPDFSVWPSGLDLSQPHNELRKLGKLEKIQGTPIEMEKVLTTSRLVQILINMWKSDESERLNRVYVLGADAESTILPKSWLSRVTDFAS